MFTLFRKVEFSHSFLTMQIRITNPNPFTVPFYHTDFLHFIIMTWST